MSKHGVQLPIIDLTGYFNPKSAEEREDVIKKVREAAAQYGFFQVRGHGVPLHLQNELWRSMSNVFELPLEEKLSMSFLENPSRRGYEASGMSLRDGDPLPDAKECFYVARDDKEIEYSGFYGPNVKPNIPEKDFYDPVMAFYEQTSRLGKDLWSILIEGLGQPVSLVEKFSQRPFVPMKMIRYPPRDSVLSGQFGIGAHTDFGGITILMQQAGKDGLEVWHDELEEWIEVSALEDVFVINCGNMVSRWSGWKLKSAKHRVINKAKGERMSCATFWHGDLNATNPLNPADDSDTVGQLLVQRFRHQYSLLPQHISQVEKRDPPKSKNVEVVVSPVQVVA